MTMNDKRREDDIYRLFNQIDTELADQRSEAPVDELERQRVKKELGRRIKMEQGKKTRKIAARAVAAAAVAVIGVTGFCVTCPAYAKELPVIGDIFKLFDQQDGGVYSSYKENATEVGETKEDNGFAVTLNDVIYDGKTLTYTYTIKTDRELGEHLSMSDDLIPDSSYGTSGMGGGMGIRKLEDGVYVGRTSLTPTMKKAPKETFQAKWKINGIFDGESGERFDCKLKFAVEAPVLEGKSRPLNQSVKAADGSVQVDLEQITVTDANMILDYAVSVSGDPITLYPDQPGRMSDRRSDIELQVTDDQGKVYNSKGNGGYSNSDEAALHEKITLEKLSEGVKTLTITVYDFRTEQPIEGIDPMIVDVSGLVK